MSDLTPTAKDLRHDLSDPRRVADTYQRVADMWRPPPLTLGDVLGPALVGLLAGWVLWPLVLG